MATHWLPTTGIVSRTADGAYGKHLKTRTPAHWLPTGQGVTVPQGGIGPTSAPGIQDVYAHPEKYGFPLAPGYKPTIPAQGFGGFGNYKDWLTKLQGWLSNLPNLPQSPIPTPKDKYPVPGRPPTPGKPGDQNPFAWRRKNSGWW